LRRIAAGELRVIFSVDVLGEGVDVPALRDHPSPRISPKEPCRMT
jgi:hypothetical protein